jgi:hypothetical protein
MEDLSLATSYIKRQYNVYNCSKYMYTAAFWIVCLYFFFPQTAGVIFYWLFLGILSAIGIGSGIPTGALYLFPYVAATAATHNVMETMLMTAIPTLSWGFGTAIGEAPPYFMAQSIQDRPEIVNMKEKMMPFIQKYGVKGVFLMACYPNLTFDACGIVCGLIDLPFWKFFGATAAGKTLVKAPAQVLFVACVSKGLMRSTSSFPIVPPSFLMNLFQIVSIAFLLYFGGLCVYDMALKEKEYINKMKIK